MCCRQLTSIVRDAWQLVTQDVARIHAGSSVALNEDLVVSWLRTRVEEAQPSLRVELRAPFQPSTDFSAGHMDLVCGITPGEIAVEVKFKKKSGGARPDNRIEAFIDLFKLESYVYQHPGSEGLFLWLTDDGGYLEVGTGRAAEFSTHQGRIYSPGTRIAASRSRRHTQGLCITLSGEYHFNWRQVVPGNLWYTFTTEVRRCNRPPTLVLMHPLS